MTDADEADDADRLPADLTDRIDALGASELIRVLDYARERLQAERRSISDLIEPRPGEEIVALEDHVGHALVTKRQPCAEGCSDCPHGAYEYLVVRERRPDGECTLRWRPLGPARDASRAE